MGAETSALWRVWDDRMHAAWGSIWVGSPPASQPARAVHPASRAPALVGKPREMGWKVAKMTKMTTMSSMKIKYFTNS